MLGALTGLVQAYGLVDTNLASLSRAPGGTFGNRNFMAHLVAIGLPVLLYVALEARSRTRFAGRRGRRRARGGGAGALALARRVARRRARAALFLVVEGLWLGRLWAEERLRRRVLRAGRRAAGGPGAGAGPAQPAQLAVGLAVSRVADRAWPTTRRGAGEGG